MSARAAPSRWGAATVALHWLSALTILGLLGLGLVMVYSIDDAAQKFDMFQLHKSLGFVALAMLAARMPVRLFSGAPLPLSSRPWEKLAAGGMHWALYLLTLIATLSGWAMASATIIPVPIRFFRLFKIPNIAPANAVLEKQLSSLHTIATWTMLALVVVHIAAALKHHLIDRDDTLRRMTPAWLTGSWNRAAAKTGA